MALFARTPRTPLEYSRTLWMRLWVVAVMLFLYAPLIILVIFSFNDSKRNVVWRGFTTKYYEKALGNDQLVEAFLTSLTIAALATVASLPPGAVAAVLLRSEEHTSELQSLMPISSAALYLKKKTSKNTCLLLITIQY